MTIKQLATRFRTLSYLLPTLILALLAVALLNTTSVSAHKATESSTHLAGVIRLQPPITIYGVTIEDKASTTEYKTEGTMLTHTHTNAAWAYYAQCGHGQYPFCFTAFSSPKTVYSHSSNSYSLTNWDVQTCVIPYLAHGRCWRSTTNLAWLTWPIDADAERSLGIVQFGQYMWVPAGSVNTFETDTYEVD